MNNSSGSQNRWMMSLHLKGRKERDNEDLHLFRELQKRDKERTACLLLPVFDELEHNNGNSPFYRIQSIRKESGFELLSEGNKNDYDWLKTPPATPLFPSLEMEAIAPRMNVQKEPPLVQPLSQPESQASNNSEKTPTTKPKIPSRFITPSHRPRINSSIESKNTKRTTTPTPNPNLRTTQTQAPSTDPTIKRNNIIINNIKSINPKESCRDYLTSNLSKGSSNTAKPNPSPRSRTTSPIVRSTIASQIPDFSDETPPNLRTDRSSSVTRGRRPGIVQKTEAISARRQSCSPAPSVTRGRKAEAKQEMNRGGNLGNDERRTESINIVGSRMVERVMNARKGNGNGIGDLGFISKNSADKALRQLIRRK